MSWIRDDRHVAFSLTWYEAQTLHLAATHERFKRLKQLPVMTRAIRKLGNQINASALIDGGGITVSMILTAYEAEALQINAGNHGERRLTTLVRAIGKIQLARWAAGIKESCGKGVIE